MSDAVATPVAPPGFVLVPVAAASAERPARNRIGAIGFVLALIGLVIPTGLVALLGLMFSLAAIGRAPRGLAAAGVVLGLLGCATWLVVMVGLVAAGVIGFVSVAALTAVGFALMQPEVVEVTSDMVNLAMATGTYVEDEGLLPEDARSLAVGDASTMDPWGGAYQIVASADGPGFDIVSAGADSIVGTGDDMRLSELDRIWEDAIGDFEQRMDALGDRMEDLPRVHVSAGRAGAYERAAMIELGN